MSMAPYRQDSSSDICLLHLRNKIWQHHVSHSGTVWAHEQSTMAEHPLYWCRSGWAAKDLFQQVMKYLEIGFLLDRLPRILTASWTRLRTDEIQVFLDCCWNWSACWVSWLWRPQPTAFIQWLHLAIHLFSLTTEKFVNANFTTPGSLAVAKEFFHTVQEAE